MAYSGLKGRCKPVILAQNKLTGYDIAQRKLHQSSTVAYNHSTVAYHAAISTPVRTAKPMLYKLSFRSLIFRPRNAARPCFNSLPHTEIPSTGIARPSAAA